MFQNRRLKVPFQENLHIYDVKKRLMNHFKLPHVICFNDFKTQEKLTSSYLLKKGDMILITTRKVNYRFKGNSFFVIIKKFANNDKILDSFKKQMTKDFKIDEKDFLNLELQKLPGQKVQISFELKSNKRFSFLDFQKNRLYLNHNKYLIKPKTT